MGRRIAVVAAAVLCGIAASCAPVTPSVAFDQGQFEGFEVFSYIPANPVGIVYFFHGTGGSASFATKTETVDVINELVGRGYGFVATESTQRTGNKRWNVSDGSLVSNPDLARLVRLHGDVVATTPVAANTPIFGVGMSNGARMVTLFGQTFADAGYPVGAIAPFSGPIANPVVTGGGLTVPTFFMYAANDQIVDNGQILSGYDATVAAGTEAVLVKKSEEPLSSIRFTRIPTIDASEAEAIYSQLSATGIWDGEGERIASVDDAVAILTVETYPPSFGATQAQIRSQIAAMLALHQFSAINRTQLADFFDAQLS